MASLLSQMLQPQPQQAVAQAPQSPQAPTPPKPSEDKTMSNVVSALGQAAGIAAMFL